MCKFKKTTGLCNKDASVAARITETHQQNPNRQQQFDFIFQQRRW